MNANRVLHVFFDVNLGNGHNGLSNIANKNKVKIDKLNIGDCVMFVNRSQTALKMFTGTGDLVVHYKMPRGNGRLTGDVIRRLPNYLSGKDFEYKKSIENVFKRQLSK